MLSKSWSIPFILFDNFWKKQVIVLFTLIFKWWNNFTSFISLVLFFYLHEQLHKNLQDGIGMLVLQQQVPQIC